MMTAYRIYLLSLAAGLCMLALPALAQQTAAVKSIPIQQLDAIVRQPGNCLVVVMAAWCHPCIEELPVLNALEQKYRGKGLRVVGISLDYAGPQAMQPILERLKVQFPVYWAGEAAIERYAISKIPLLILIRDGRTLRRLEGGRNRATLEKEILAFLGEEQ
jgi:thiol-disulfide isomerase/thioredoxin